MKNKLLKIFILVLVFGISKVPYTNSCFSSGAMVNGTISTGDWTETSTPTPTSTPTSTSTETPTPTPTGDPAEPQDVVINEVYYHGGSDEEWVEIYNNSGGEVDLSEWEIQDNTHVDTFQGSDLTLDNGQYAVIVGTGNSGQTVASGALLIQVDDTAVGNSLADSDKLVLLNSDNQPVDAISWGNDTSELNPAIDSVADGYSIARKTPGEDNDSKDDWQKNTSPNPGTNPHSHVQVDISQSGHDLIVNFDNAEGFDEVKYSVFYQRQHEGEEVDMQIKGEKDKPIDVEQFSLDPLYFGSCSSLGVVCTPHRQVKNVEVHLLYKNGNVILGSSSYDFDWQN